MNNLSVKFNVHFSNTKQVIALEVAVNGRADEQTDGHTA